MAWDATVAAPSGTRVLRSRRQPSSSVRATASSSSSNSSRTERTEEPNHRLQRLPMAESSSGTCRHQWAVSRCTGLRHGRAPGGLTRAGPAPTTALGSRLAHRVNGCLLYCSVVELLVEDVHLGHVAPGARQRCEGQGSSLGPRRARLSGGGARMRPLEEEEECTHLRLGLGLLLWLELLRPVLPSTARIQSCTQKPRCGHCSSQPSGCCGAGVRAGVQPGPGWALWDL